MDVGGNKKIEDFIQRRIARGPVAALHPFNASVADIGAFGRSLTAWGIKHTSTSVAGRALNEAAATTNRLPCGNGFQRFSNFAVLMTSPHWIRETTNRATDQHLRFSVPKKK